MNVIILITNSALLHITSLRVVQQKHCGSATLHVHTNQPEVYKRFKILFGPLRIHSEENKLANDRSTAIQYSARAATLFK